MKTDIYGQMIFSEDDVCDLLMQGRAVESLNNLLVDQSVDLESIITFVEDFDERLCWTFPQDSNISVPVWHSLQQNNWLMPQQYQDLDIAEYVLTLCKTDAELQRVGQELLLYQERNLFNLLRYLKYLVDVMHDNRVIWGVGRGSSVASYVLYLLGVHRINSIHYDLDPAEFLR